MLSKCTVLLLGAAFFITACGHARLVRQTQEGGVLALEGDRGKAMEDATAKMNAHCGPNNWTITEQGETVIGTDSVHGEDTTVAEDGQSTSTEGGSSTRQATEWRLTYQCGR